MFSEMLLPLSYQRICVNSYRVFVLPLLNLFSILLINQCTEFQVVSSPSPFAMKYRIDFHPTYATPIAAPGTAAMDSSDAAPPAAMLGVTANMEPAATLPIYTLDSVACVISLVIRPIK